MCEWCGVGGRCCVCGYDHDAVVDVPALRPVVATWQDRTVLAMSVAFVFVVWGLVVALWLLR